MIHPYSLNGSAAHTKMEHREMQEERGKEPEEESSEEHFLKDLYIFMKKRDTPIERIPHLGFKQIDLFVMFKTVKELGGYHQVTAQQLWKQVYNTLGGNPRSTSAATCTRRHYEKLLLPYECHLKGVLMNVLPQQQPKHFGFAPYGKEDDDGQRAAKRKLLSLPLHQNHHGLQSDHPHPSVFPSPLHHPHYYAQSHAVLPPYIPIPPPLMPSASAAAAAAAAQHRFSFHPPRLSPPEQVKEPLEQLRFLAEQYKTSSGLSEPLNLSVKGEGPRAASRAPASSFAPPSSTNPKFLNTPSPLYAAHYAQVARGGAGKAQEGDEEDSGEEAGFVIDLRDKSASSSPGRSSDEGFAGRKRSFPGADYEAWQAEEDEEREGSPEARRPDPGQVRRGGPPPDSKMEIEIPISVFHNWLRMYGAAKQLRPPVQEHLSGQSDCFNKEPLPANLTFHINSQLLDRSAAASAASIAAAAAAAEDLRLRKRSVPSPTSSSNHLNASQHHFTSYKSSSGLLKGAAGRDVYLFDRQDITKSCSSRAARCWNERDKEGQTSPARAKNDCSPVMERDLSVSKGRGGEDDGEQGGRRSATSPSAVLMVNSGSASLLQLTTEEVMKLKKIISSSS